MLEPAVDRLARAVGGAGPVEVGEHVPGAALECAAERDELAQRGGDAGAEGVDHGSHQGPPAGFGLRRGRRR